MAKIGLFTWPGAGHVNPMAALGRRLMTMGHHVSFVQVVDMQETIESAGLRFIVYGKAAYPRGRIRELNEAVSKLTGLKALQCIVDGEILACTVQLAELPAIMRTEKFDLMLVDALQPAALTVAEYLEIPAITIDLLPPVFDEASAPPFIFGWAYKRGFVARCRNYLGNRIFFSVWKKFMKIVAVQRKEWELPPHKGINDIFSKRLRITQMPAFLDFPRDRIPPGFVYAGPFTDEHARKDIPFPWERLDGRKLIYASLGTLQNGVGAVFQAIVDAVHGLNVQLVLSTGGGIAKSDLKSLPLGAIVVNMAPQLNLIERASLVITHAGHNTSLEALQAGKPMVAIPIASDQPGVAARLKRVGVAEVIPLRQANSLRIKAAIKKVLGEKNYLTAAMSCKAQLKPLKGLDKAAELIDGELKMLGRSS